MVEEVLRLSQHHSRDLFAHKDQTREEATEEILRERSDEKTYRAEVEVEKMQAVGVFRKSVVGRKRSRNRHTTRIP